MPSYYVYLALGENHPYIGFTHDPYVDAAVLSCVGYTRFFAAAKPLPIDAAAAVVWDLRQETGADTANGFPLFDQLSCLTSFSSYDAGCSKPRCSLDAARSAQRDLPDALHEGRRRISPGPFSAVRLFARILGCGGHGRLSSKEVLDKGIDPRDHCRDAASWLKLIRRHLKRQGADRFRDGFQFREISFAEMGSLHGQVPPLFAADIPLELLESIGRLVEGRVLSYDEIRSFWEQGDVENPIPLRDLLQICALAGKLEIKPGIASLLDDYRVCSRCGERHQLERIHCPLCGRPSCAVCLACRSLGEVRSCRELYYGRVWEEPDIRKVYPDLRPQLHFQLSRAQAEAAAEFKRYVERWLGYYCGAERQGDDLPENTPQGHTSWGGEKAGGKGAGESLGFAQPWNSWAAAACGQAAAEGSANSCLVWAVCGAGKTEIAFEGLALAVGAGLKAVFAVPRRDVVVEVAERAQAAFPQISVTALYSGAEHPKSLGQLVVATTHQLIRFSGYFDLAILDEADAFPYAGSAVLHRALGRAVKPCGLKVYMTATPVPAMIQAARRGKVHLITVPVRHHGYPVPVPQVILCRQHLVPKQRRDSTARGGYRGRFSDLNLPPQFWLKLKESLAAGSRVFVFVPRIWLVEAVAGEIRGCPELAGVPVFAAHSRNPKRDRHRELFQKTAPSVMVATSILERGITVPKADVIVAYAHDDLYDARALIQMAGRSGRDASYPTGKVYFIAAAETKAIRWAVECLQEINEDARRRGLLVPGTQGEHCCTRAIGNVIV